MTKQKVTWHTVIQRVLIHANKPLTAEGIWKYALDHELLDGYETSGKTPDSSIAAYIYTDIKANGDKSQYIKVGKRPTRFQMRGWGAQPSAIQEDADENSSVESTIAEKIKERDLHAVLATYLLGNSHFNARSRTIYHEKSKRQRKGKNEWLHPDMVGVYFPFDDYDPDTRKLQDKLSENPMGLFSFELKIELNLSNLREYWFQAVSNSSWAHEGYLVTLFIRDEEDVLEELRRLNNAFGIGVIKLNLDNVPESQILYPSEIRNEVDWETVDRLVAENDDFRSFVNDLLEDMEIGKVKSKYDEVMEGEKLEKYLDGLKKKLN